MCEDGGGGGDQTLAEYTGRFLTAGGEHGLVFWAEEPPLACSNIQTYHTHSSAAAHVCVRACVRACVCLCMHVRAWEGEGGMGGGCVVVCACALGRTGRQEASRPA